MNVADFEIVQGDDTLFLVTVLNSTDGSAADLTGYSAQAQIRTGPADQSQYVMAEIQCTVAPPNFISLFLTSAQTRQLSGLYYRWDLELITPAGYTYTLMCGDVEVTSEVTREGDPLWPTTTSGTVALPRSYPLGFPSQVLSVRLGRQAR